MLLHTGALIEQRGSVAQVGSPKMNLLPGRLVSAEAGHARLEVAGQVLTVAVDARAVPAGGTVQVGVRPEHMAMADSGEGAALAATLLHVERLGDSSLLYANVGPGLPTMTVKMDGNVSRAPGSTLTLRLRPAALHLFDGDGKACARTVDLPV